MDLVDMPVLQMLMLAIMFFAILVEIKTGGLGAGSWRLASFGAASM